MTKQSSSQTVGPFFAYGLVPEPYGRKGIASNTLAANGAEGERIVIEGRVLDGRGEPVNDALIEIWQANAHGRYRHARDARDGVPLDPGFTGFGRAMTDDKGVFRFETVKPGRVPGGGNAWQAPHIGVTVLARGMPNHAYSRIYFSDEEKANAEDPVLALVPPARRGTLIARREAGAAVYRFDIRLQGEDETVFFDA